MQPCVPSAWHVAHARAALINLSVPLVIAESRSRDGSTPCRRVFRTVGSVPRLTNEAYCPERVDGAKFPSCYA